MKNIIRATPLYNFLWYCNQLDIEKTVLDCGAAGFMPPLTIFNEQGYKTCGIDIDRDMIEVAHEYEKKNGIQLNISYGDMRDIKFDDNTFSFVYSYNSIFHMTKKDIAKSIGELKRVTNKYGLIFLNLLSVDDFLYGVGEKVGEDEYLQDEGDSSVVHTFYKDDEADILFSDSKIIHKEKRIIERLHGDEKIKQAFIDYIIKV
jgi:ubiquinone/menaquinone biosynthesis C-methylase UbiE